MKTITLSEMKTLHAIRDMLHTDNHTRTHWYYNTIMCHSDNARIKNVFYEIGAEVPCGAIGCAWGHAMRLKIIQAGVDWHIAFPSLSNHEKDFIFSNFDIHTTDRHLNRAVLGKEGLTAAAYALAITPDTIAARIDFVLSQYELAE